MRVLLSVRTHAYVRCVYVRTVLFNKGLCVCTCSMDDDVVHENSAVISNYFEDICSKLLEPSCTIFSSFPSEIISKPASFLSTTDVINNVKMASKLGTVCKCTLCVCL